MLKTKERIFTQQCKEQNILSPKKNITEKIVTILLIIMIGLFLIAICWINFSKNSNMYYDIDMYSDMTYAGEVWKNKSIFPEGWVFGNQFYVIATPVLAAFFFGITGNCCLSMGIASTIMSIGVLLSFCWMLLSVTKNKSSSFFGMFFLLFISLITADFYRWEGIWELLFTKCTYYACYAITAFLCFGSYLRISNSEKLSKNTIVVLIFSAAFSFATGMHSLRQTAIMVLPMISVEAVFCLIRLVKKKKFFQKETFFVLIISMCNLAGVLLINSLDISKKTIFGEFQVDKISLIFSKTINSILLICKIFVRKIKSEKSAVVLFIIVLLLFLLLMIWVLKKSYNGKNNLKCISLFVFSIGVVCVVGILTTLSVRSVYYFMIIPMTAVLCTLCFDVLKTKTKLIFVCVAILLTVSIGIIRIDRAVSFLNEYSDTPAEVTEYLSDNKIDTIYSCWSANVGTHSVSIASDWKIKAGFWYEDSEIFVPVDYLCNPNVYKADAKHCAYIFNSKESADNALKIAKERGVEMKFMKYFENNNMWIYTAPVNLMQLEK